MKILIHGATDQGSSNFGDFIYGNELFKICARNNNVCFDNPSEYVKKYIQGYSESMSIKMRRTDASIYIQEG